MSRLVSILLSATAAVCREREGKSLDLMKRNIPTELFDIIELERSEKRKKTRNTRENEQTNSNRMLWTFFQIWLANLFERILSLLSFFPEKKNDVRQWQLPILRCCQTITDTHSLSLSMLMAYLSWKRRSCSRYSPVVCVFSSTPAGDNYRQGEGKSPESFLFESPKD